MFFYVPGQPASHKTPFIYVGAPLRSGAEANAIQTRLGEDVKMLPSVAPAGPAAELSPTSGPSPPPGRGGSCRITTLGLNAKIKANARRRANVAPRTAKLR